MALELILKEGYLLVHLQGDLDLHSVDKIRAVVDNALNRGGVHTLLLDLSQVPFMDSSGLGFILGRYRHLKKKGGQVVLIAPGSQVRRVLKLAGVKRIIEIYDSKKAACRAQGEVL
ncbi:MAG: anti-sigma factor antagonist [Firmicutes bacterium]|nr:anti-sigma factor antagonist [Bacillota bacterium]